MKPINKSIMALAISMLAMGASAQTNKSAETMDTTQRSEMKAEYGESTSKEGRIAARQRDDATMQSTDAMNAKQTRPAQTAMDAPGKQMRPHRQGHMSKKTDGAMRPAETAVDAPVHRAKRVHGDKKGAMHGMKRVTPAPSSDVGEGGPGLNNGAPPVTTPAKR